jgi:hypothetical protein
VNVSQNGTGDVRIVVTLNSLDKFVNGGQDDTFDFNISGQPSITIANLTAGFSLNAGAGNVVGAPGSHMADGSGTFDFSIHCSACQNGASSPVAGPLAFDVIATGLTPDSFNSTGAHSSVDTMTADVFGNGNTGYVGSGAPIRHDPVVPEPTSILLFGTALFASVHLLKRKFTS